jgi:hypothetical protein
MPRRGPRSRRWCVPPAILRGPDETLEGAAILVEIPGDLGVLLWRAARDVRLWSEAPPDARENLFADGSGDQRLASLAATDIPSAISAQIDTINGMLTVPGRADADVLTICCLEVAAWARRDGLVHTAVEFAQAGALASPEFAEAALHTGIAAAAAGQDARARTWLRRTVTLARREKDRDAYMAGLLELAAIYERRGDPDRAEHYYRWTYRTSRKRKGASAVRMRAAHGLLRVARPRDSRKATQFAIAALRAYRPNSQGGPELLLDLAGFWMELGEGDRAAAVLRLLARFRSFLSPADQLASSALTARVLAGRDPKLSTAAEQEAWRLFADETLPQDVRFRAALDLAHAGCSTGDLAAFTRAKREVLRLAPQEVFPRVSSEVAALWPEGERGPELGRAS